jgi:eukaryotic-like serine/threonine-protein kinase
MAGFTVPGFDVDQLLNRGWGGELWSARGRATGRPVVLRRIAVADDPASHDRVRLAAGRLVGVAHPHLVGLRGALSLPGAVVLVHDQVAGVGLDRRLAEGRSLSEAEVVAIAAPIASALAALHVAGLCHGRVSPTSVLIGNGGPMLADAGIAALLDGHDRPTGAADDVRDLALTCRAALGPTAPAHGFAAVLAAATLADAARRPPATQLAAAILASVPVPRALARPASRSPASHRRTPSRRRRRGSRRWVALVVAVGASAAAALTGLAWAAVDPGAPAATVQRHEPASVVDPGAAIRWRSVLASLDARRSAAFATASARRLADVYADDAPALRRDRARLADLATAGLLVDRLKLRARSVRVVSSSPRRTVLEVVDVLAPYDVRTTRGALVAARPGRGAASWRVTLVRVGREWRVYDVVGG